MIRRVPTLAPRWTRTTYNQAMGVQPQKGMVKIIGHTLPNNQPNERIEMNRNETKRRRRRKQNSNRIIIKS